MPTITLQQHFNAPRQAIFDTLCDHVQFGRLTGARIQRIKDGKAPFPNGLGSVRRISVFPAPAFEETVVAFASGEYMEYRVTKGSPIKNHTGRLVFSDDNGGTLLNYTITFEPKLPLPFLGGLLKLAIEVPIARGLRRFAATLKR
jgi:hypothetical protein